MTGKKRHLESKIVQLLDIFPAVAIVGSRQAGKTTLAQQVKPNWKYFDLERPSHMDQIEADPEFFFSQNPEHIILDEAQGYPELFKVLRGVIDRDREKKGRFILSGSSSFELLSQISESLAGRIAIVEVGTLSMSEVAGIPISDFYNLFESGVEIDQWLESLNVRLSDDQVNRHWLRGGYPEPALNDDQFHEHWMNEYFATYLNRDIRRLFPRLQINKYRRFVAMLAGLSGTILNRAEIAHALDVSEPTVKEYIDIIHGTFVWRNLSSFEHQIKKSVIKMPRGHYRDSGLCHFTQKIGSIDQLLDHPSSGRSFEAFVIEEILKGLVACSVSGWSAHFYRTRNRAEIDLILHGKFGVIPIEIKSGVETSRRSLKTLNAFVEEHDLPLAILINRSDEVAKIGPKLVQIPITCF